MLRSIIALAAITFAVGACVGGSGAARSTPLPQDPSSANLAAVVDRVVPKGFTRLESRSGVLGLEEAASLGQDPEREGAALRQNGFVRGHVRLWQKEPASIVVVAYEFADEQGAQAYERYSIEDATTNHGATLFDVPNVADATGQVQVEGDASSALYLKAITFVRSVAYFAIAAGGPSEPTTKGLAVLAETLEQLAA